MNTKPNRRRTLLLGLVLVMGACSFLSAGGEQAVGNDRQPTAEEGTVDDLDVSTSQPADAEAEKTPELNTIPASIATQAPLPTNTEVPAAKFPKEFKLPIVEQTFILTEEGSHPGLEKSCSNILMYAAAVALNDTGGVLGGVNLYIEAFDGDLLIQRFQVNYGYPGLINPGSEVPISSGYAQCWGLPKEVTDKYEFSDLRYEIAVYASQNYGSDQPYENLEILSVNKMITNTGTSFLIKVANNGNQPAYAQVHGILYDQEGNIMDTYNQSVNSDVEPYSFLIPGHPAEVTFFSEAEVADIKVFVSGIILEE